ncbi:ATP-binding protein [Streptomyces sp. NPDC004059]
MDNILGRRKALSPPMRDAYDEARIAYYSELQVVRTSTVKDIAHQGRLLTLLNQREHGARRGLIVSGEWTSVKTTALKQLGRLHELRVRQRSPGSDRIPVVYITALPKGSPRKLAMQFARFLGLPVIGPRHNTSAVCQVLIEARTDLVLVDEIHLLNHATIAGEDLSDHLNPRAGPLAGVVALTDRPVPTSARPPVGAAAAPSGATSRSAARTPR